MCLGARYYRGVCARAPEAKLMVQTGCWCGGREALKEGCTKSIQAGPLTGAKHLKRMRQIHVWREAKL